VRKSISTLCGLRAVAIFLVVVAMLVIASGMVLASCSGAPATNPTISSPQQKVTETLGPVESAPSDPSTPITVRLILSKVPQLNELVDLTFIVSSVLDAPNTTATILLPDGAVLVDGDLEWAGDLAANELQILKASFKFITEGNWTIEGKALRPLDNGDVWGDAAYIYLHVSEETSHLGFPTEPPPPSSDAETVPSPAETPGPVESAPSDPSTPITARLILSKVPQLNELVDLTFIVSSVLDAPGTTTTILLSDGAILVDGDLEWAGDLAANEPQTLRASFKFVTEGNWTIEARALRPLDNGDVWGDVAYIYLHVSEEVSHIGFSTEPPPHSSDKEAPLPTPVNPSP